MNEQRIKEVFSDEAFVKQLLEQEEPEQVKALLAEKDIEVSIREIETLRDMIVKHCSGELNMEELSEADLENVSGGGVGILLLLGVIVGGAAVGAVVGGGGAAAAEHFTRGRW